MPGRTGGRLTHRFPRHRRRGAANPELKIIVVDPRRSESAEIADLHLAIKPGTDIALYNGMLHVLIAEGMLDADFIAQHTGGFDELQAIVSRHAPQAVADVCGWWPRMSCRQLVGSRSGAALSLYCQG